MDGEWDKAYRHAAGGVCLVVGDELYFYYGAWSGDSPNLKSQLMGQHTRANAMYAGGATGVAVLRRDGFASLSAGNAGGELITKTLRYTGNRLFVNCDTQVGQMKVETLDAENRVISAFLMDNCRTIAINSTKHLVTWNNTGDISSLKNRLVRFRISLINGSIFSFWVSKTLSGENNGFVAAGGFGYKSPRDTGE